jgi:hypothetical protein
MASFLNIGPVYIDPWRKASLAKQGNNCAKRELPRLKARVSSEEFL